MKVIDLKYPAQKQATSENTSCILSPDGTEAITFDPQELQDLIDELSSGRINLDYLAEHLKLTCHQLHYAVQYLQTIGKIKGELTYSTFTASCTSKALYIEKMKAQKHEHMKKMRKK